MLIPDKVLHNETQRHVARMTQRDDDHIEDLDALIRGLITHKIWPLLDFLCVAGPHEGDSLLDLKGTQDSVKVGSPAFVADAGFTTVSTTDVINTQFTTPDDHASNSSLMVYIQNASIGGNSFFVGEKYGAGGSYNALPDGVTTIQGAQHQLTTYVLYATPGADKGFRMSSRYNPSQQFSMAEGISYTSTVAALAWESGLHYPLAVGCANIKGTLGAASPNEYSAWSCGKSLTVAESFVFYELIKAYFTRRGTAV